MTTFPTGGVKPLSLQKALERGYWNAAVPSTCVVPLQQHVGSRLDATVKPGDLVREGMVIADSSSRLAVPIHAPIPGRVVSAGRTVLFDGSESQSLAIELDGEFDRLGKKHEPLPWNDRDAKSLLSLIRAGGVVCSPRSAVPAHLHLQRRRSHATPYLVLDLAETEPYLSADVELCAAEPQAVLEGLRIVARIVEAREVCIVASREYGYAVKALRAVSDGSFPRIHRVAHRYSANTTREVRRRIGLSADGEDEDLVIISPSTAFGIYEAVVYRKPQIDRVVAVGGGAVKRPAHVRVRIGTAIADVIEECGGLIAVPERIMADGTLTGRVVSNINAPITKTTAAIVALTPDEVNAEPEEPLASHEERARSCSLALNPLFLNAAAFDGRYDSPSVSIADGVEGDGHVRFHPADDDAVDAVREACTAATLADPLHPHSFRMLVSRGVYLRLSLALAFPVLVGALRLGASAIPLIVAGLLGAFLAELAVGIATNRPGSGVRNGRTLYYGLLVVALSPVDIPPSFVAAAAAITVLFGVWLPGGPGAGWLHPVAVGLALVPAFYDVGPWARLGDTLPTMLTAFESGAFFQTVQNRVFIPLGMRVPPDALLAIVGLDGGAGIGFTSGLLIPLLASALIVFGEDLVPVVLPVTYFCGFVLCVRLAGGDVFAAMLSTNVALIGLAGLADPGIRPVKVWMIALFGLLAGSCTGLLTAWNGTPVPAVVGLLIVGSFRPLLNVVSTQRA
ncbi:MAG: RnfABCDGE type electron transport complex subunit D [Spirochaetales bacterium]|nr:RnfABCDGE type electron transport complex subunit D [Spirochaetales bacterium]